MLIKALCDYSDKQSTESGSNKIPEGFSEQDIHYRIILSEDGDLKRIIPFKQIRIIKDKKGKEKSVEVPRKAILPIRTQKSGIDSNFIEHRPLYIFGLNFDKDSFSPDDKTNKARKSHAAFVEHEIEFFDGLESVACNAYRKFVEKWNPENEYENAVLIELGKEYKGAYFGFSIGEESNFLEKDEDFIRKYQKYFSEMNETKDDEVKAVCGILGEKAVTARLHDKIKFPGGQASGCQLVCMNDTAFESYGKTQSYNSNVSEEAMKKYTTVFNKLLSDKKHYCILGDMVLLWFAVKNDDSAESSFISCFFGNNSDTETNDKIAKIMEYARSGFTVDKGSIDAILTDKKAVFYIAGLTPNSSRICQKFMYKGNFGDMLNNLIKHQNDMLINEKNIRPMYFGSIAKELISPKSTNDKVSPPLMSAIILAALNNTKYPDSLLATVIRRVKTDSDEENKPYIKLNDTRAGIIKACLNRKYKKEEITMSWNDDNKNPAYLCGGLFAVYEKIQKESSGGNLNRTIKDSYFASACSRPSSVFPKLAKLAQNHIKKVEQDKPYFAKKYKEDINDLIDGLDGEFPATLGLDDQGRFIVGYYQMNKKLYTSNKSE